MWSRREKRAPRRPWGGRRRLWGIRGQWNLRGNIWCGSRSRSSVINWERKSCRRNELGLKKKRKNRSRSSWIARLGIRGGSRSWRKRRRSGRWRGRRRGRRSRGRGGRRRRTRKTPKRASKFGKIGKMSRLRLKGSKREIKNWDWRSKLKKKSSSKNTVPRRHSNCGPAVNTSASKWPNKSSRMMLKKKLSRWTQNTSRESRN